MRRQTAWRAVAVTPRATSQALLPQTGLATASCAEAIYTTPANTPPKPVHSRSARLHPKLAAAPSGLALRLLAGASKRPTAPLPRHKSKGPPQHAVRRRLPHPQARLHHDPSSGHRPDPDASGLPPDRWAALLRAAAQAFVHLVAARKARERPSRRATRGSRRARAQPGCEPGHAHRSRPAGGAATAGRDLRLPSGQARRTTPRERTAGAGRADARCAGERRRRAQAARAGSARHGDRLRHHVRRRRLTVLELSDEPLSVVPLFETISDLGRAPDVVRELLVDPRFAQRVEDRSRSRGRRRSS